MAHHNSSGILIADFISLSISMGSIGLAAFGHLTENLQAASYVVSITAGLFAIFFGYLNYRINKKRNKKP